MFVFHNWDSKVFVLQLQPREHISFLRESSNLKNLHQKKKKGKEKIVILPSRCVFNSPLSNVEPMTSLELPDHFNNLL